MGDTRYRGPKQGEACPVSIPEKATNRAVAPGALLEHPILEVAHGSCADLDAEREHRYPHALVFERQGRDQVPIPQQSTREP